MIATALLWAATVLAAIKTYEDLREARPHWELRTELATIAAAAAIMILVAAALGAAGYSPTYNTAAPTPPPTII